MSKKTWTCYDKNGIPKFQFPNSFISEMVAYNAIKPDTSDTYEEPCWVLTKSYSLIVTVTGMCQNQITLAFNEGDLLVNR